ncbi:MAG: response regulator [Anaerolineales bacterium]
MPEKILIVDDDADTLRLVGLMLQRQGYEVVAASNGPQALQKAEEEEPDLILLDVMMPGMDGYEVARRLRANPITANTPILMFTAKSQIDDKLVGFESGADDYLTKPTHPAELQAHVRALLARSGREQKKKSTATATLIGALAARGGLGVTTIATNLGAALYKAETSEVIIAEMVPGNGTLGLEMGFEDRGGLSRLLSLPPQEITRQKVLESLVRHPSGLKFLLASEKPSEKVLINNVEQYAVIVARLATLAHFVLLDLGNGLLPFVPKILPFCHHLLIVTEPSPNTVLHTRVLLDDLKKMGVSDDKLKVVLNNRVRSETILPALEVQNRLSYPLAATITPAPELFHLAMRTRNVAYFAQPESLTARQIAKLASIFRPPAQAA